MINKIKNLEVIKDLTSLVKDANTSLFDVIWMIGVAFIIWFTKLPWFVDLVLAVLLCMVFSILSTYIEDNFGKDVTDELNKED